MDVKKINSITFCSTSGVFPENEAAFAYGFTDNDINGGFPHRVRLTGLRTILIIF